MSVCSEADFASLMAEMAVKIPQDVADTTLTTSFMGSNGVQVGDLDFVLPPPKTSTSAKENSSVQQPILLTNGNLSTTKNGETETK